MVPDEDPIVSRVEEQKANGLDSAVTQFQGQSTLKRLKVARPGLRLEGMPPRGADRYEIPGAPVPRLWERDFGQDANGSMEQGTQSIEQRRVCRVADRLTPRNDADRET